MDPLALLVAVESGRETSLKWWQLIWISGLVSRDSQYNPGIDLISVHKNPGEGGRNQTSLSFLIKTRDNWSWGLIGWGSPHPYPGFSSWRGWGSSSGLTAASLPSPGGSWIFMSSRPSPISRAQPFWASAASRLYIQLRHYSVLWGFFGVCVFFFKVTLYRRTPALK